MTTANRYMTAEDLWRMPPDHMRHELVNGELKTMAPAGFNHGSIGMKIGVRLLQHVDSRKLGVVVGADTGFTLRRNPDTVRAPDAAFVKASRIPSAGATAKFFEGAPDLAVEVLSPSDTAEDVEEKIHDYLNAGCSLVWIVNSKQRTVTVYRPRENPVILNSTDTLDGGETVPGFSCRVADLFS